MDNAAKEFARQIISELHKLRSTLHEYLESIITSGVPRQGDGDAPIVNGRPDDGGRNAKPKAPPPFAQSSAHPSVSESHGADQKQDPLLTWLKQHVVEVITLIVLSLYTSYAGRQSRIMQATLDHMRASERAFLNFDAIKLGAMMVENERWVMQEFHIGFINSGTTPARNAVERRASAVFDGDIPKDFKFGYESETQRNTLVIGPKATVYAPILVPVNEIYAAYSHPIGGSNSRLFFWGEVVYKDIFPGDPERLTEFCVEMMELIATSANRGVPNNLVNWQLRGCGTHVCYDEDCPDYAERVKDARKK